MIYKHLVFSYDNDETMPCMIGFGHNLKGDNICSCESYIIFENDNYRKIHKKQLIKIKILIFI